MKQLSAPELKSMLDRREVILFDIRPEAALLIYKGDQHVVDSLKTRTP